MILGLALATAGAAKPAGPQTAQSESGTLSGNIDDLFRDAARPMGEPSAATKRYMEGEALFKSGRIREAIEAFDSSIALDSRMDAAYVYRGMSRARLGDHAGAIADYDQGIAVTGRSKVWSWWPRFHKGLSFGALRRWDDAVRELSASIELNPTAGALVARGSAYLYKRDFAKAEQDASVAEKSAGRNPNLWATIAGIHLVAGDLDVGCKAARKACDLGQCNVLREFTEANRLQGTCSLDGPLHPSRLINPASFWMPGAIFSAGIEEKPRRKVFRGGLADMKKTLPGSITMPAWSALRASTSVSRLSGPCTQNEVPPKDGVLALSGRWRASASPMASQRLQ
jgi:tetratricopeptide (TPR) repeat protein